MTVEHAERIKRFADSQNPKVSIQAALNYAVELGINSPEFTKARN